MPPKRRVQKAPPEQKRLRRFLSQDQKLAVLRMLDAGESNTVVGRQFGLRESTVRGIKKAADKIKGLDSVTSQDEGGVRAELLALMERELGVYMEGLERSNTPVNSEHVRVKALEIYGRLCAEAGDLVSSDDISSFTARRGWLNKVISRHRLRVGHSAVQAQQAVQVVQLHDSGMPSVFTELLAQDQKPGVSCFQLTLESPDVGHVVESPDVSQVGGVTAQLEAMINKLGVSPKQMFNVGQTGLFWKRLPRRTYINQAEQQNAARFQPGEDRLSLLLCANAEGDCKMKPLVVYQSLNPPALKGLSKNMLPVHWAANKRAMVTGQVVEDWFVNHFAVEAERYCREQRLEFKVLLFLSDIAAHPKHLDSLHPSIRVCYIPAKVAPLIQPLDLGVKAMFKVNYLQRILAQMKESTDDFDSPGSRPSAQEWWSSFNILHAINNMDEAWRGVSPASINISWKSICPDCVYLLTGTTIYATTVQMCVELGRKIGGAGFDDLMTTDVLDLLASHDEDVVRTRPPISSHTLADDNDEEESLELRVKDFTVSQLAEFFRAGERLAQMAIDMDPSLERSQSFSRSLQAIMAPYKQIYAEKQNSSQHMINTLGSPTVLGHPALAASLQAVVKTETSPFPPPFIIPAEAFDS